MEVRISFTPLPLFPQGNKAGSQYIGGWAGPRIVLDDMKKRKMFFPCRESNHDSSAVQPVA
jgi:hypothetical protein